MFEVLLVGSPNTGKSTLFNALTGQKVHTGNFNGVTVTEARAPLDSKTDLVDLPGVYSLTPLSFEEKVTIEYLEKHKEFALVNICDSEHLERNLYLTLCLMERGYPMVLAVNVTQKERKIDALALERALGIKVVTFCGKTGKGVEDVRRLCQEATRAKPLPYAKLLSGQIEADSSLRFGCVDKILREVGYKKERKGLGADKFLLNKFLAIPIFFGIMALVFYITFFSVGAFLSDLLTLLLDGLTSPLVAAAESLPEAIRSLLCDGIIAGVGTVLSFLPQVGILMLCLSILEESGYLSRLAFLTQDLLAKVGLSGRGVYTLLMGFGCSTSAILTARNMDDEKSKIKTALLTQYCSCSAKLPIYAAIGGAFFGANNIFVIMFLYALGIVIALALAFVLEKTILPSPKQSFVLEFTDFHSLNIRQALSVFSQSVKAFLLRVGGAIMAMNLVIWLLSNFSLSFAYVGSSGGSALESFGKVLAPLFTPLGFGCWGAVAALIGGLIAKEVVLSSIALFNGTTLSTLGATLTLSSSAAYFASPAAALSFLVFCLLYFPCLSSLMVLKKEIGAKYTFIGALIQLVVAYVASFVLYTGALALQAWGWAFVVVALAICITVLGFATFFKHKKCERCAKCKK